MFPQPWYRSVLVACTAFALTAGQAAALRLDEFSTGTQLATSEAVTPPASATPGVSGVVTNGAIGGRRVLIARATGGDAGGIVTARVSTVAPGKYFHSQDSSVTGSSTVLWDGGTDGVISAAGLQSGAGINLLQDIPNGTIPAIRIQLDSFDLPSGSSGISSLTVTLFDAIDPTNLVHSTVTFPLVQSGGQQIVLSQPQFAPGPLGVFADWTRIGAVALSVNGIAPDADLSLGAIRTNGICDLVPDAFGKVIDECGVCGGDNSSCADCLGVPNGPAVPGTSCNSGQPGSCSTGVFSEGCGCIAPPPSNEVCDGIDNNCDGSVDESFTQLGTDCAVGSGVCSQGGIFVCNDQGGVRCNADVLEPLTIACEESKGCDGIPESGLVLDQCSVCGGDGKSCQDCSGVPYGPSTLDRCGVCNGDGNSCLGCSNVDLSELLTALDGGAKQQERTVRRILGQLAKSKPNRADRNKVESLKRTAHRLQIRNWTLSWTVPVVTTTCTNTSFCVASSSDWILTEYRKNSEELRQLAIESAALVKRIRKGRFPAGPKLLVIADAQHASNMALADTVPVNNFSCSAP